ncbi:MAG: response regulator [Solirubrobacterales bacterium]
MAGRRMTSVCRVLLIEDDTSEADAIEKACCPDPGGIAFEIAANSAAAEDALRDNEYDLIVSDLALPADERQFDPDVDEGLRLFQLIREGSGGTPVIVLSGHANLHIVSRFFSANQMADLYGTKTDQPIVQFFAKEDLPDCVAAVRSHIAKTQALDRFELEAESVTLGLSDQRALKIYGRRQGGVRGIVERIDDGLSGAKTFKVSYLDPSGTGVGTVVAKLDDLRTAVREADRYAQVAPRMPAGLGAPILYVISAGAGQRGALIYQLADEDPRSLFGLIAESEEAEATAVVSRLRGNLSEWSSGNPDVARGLAEIRRPLVSDLDLREAGFEIPAERDVSVNVKAAMSHGDLHGLNVLVSQRDEPTLIDYGDVRNANAALDPITLELSALFHPVMGGRLGLWPSLAQAADWIDLDTFSVGCPIPDYVRACREWAVAVSAGEGEILATAYAFALRQLKFPDTNHDLARAIAMGAYDRLAGS